MNISKLDSHGKSFVKGPAGGATSNVIANDKTHHVHLVGQTIPIDKLECRIKGRVICRGEELYALESDKSMRLYNGQCPMCRMFHVEFTDPSRGYYAMVKDVHDKVFGDKLANERSQFPKDIDKLLAVSEDFPPLDHPVCGENKGIEGDSNSGYLDSTIFCMFAYSKAFDSLLHMKVRKQAKNQLQTLLRENIVNVLRSDRGYVEREYLLDIFFPKHDYHS